MTEWESGWEIGYSAAIEVAALRLRRIWIIGRWLSAWVRKLDAIDD